jgi:TetR/AcrR family transcriptional regulator, transcriptional repressor for nem operon
MKLPSTRPPLIRAPARYILSGMSKPADKVLPRRQPDQTRKQLLQCAFAEIHRAGFRAASLDAILEHADVTKGALYHHFGSKAELGYAVVDEVLRPWVEAHWKPALDADEPIDAAVAMIRQHLSGEGEINIELGCPFNNLCQEMSPVDEGFRLRLNRILHDWRAGIAEVVRRAQARGKVRADVDADAAAAFVVGSIEGCVGMAKAAQSRDFLEAGMRGLIEYLQRLRPPQQEAT